MQAPAYISTQVRSARRFYRHLAPGRVRDLSLVCGGWEDCAPDYEINRSGFPYLALEFVASGGGELTVGGKRSELQPGAIFVYGPGVAYQMKTGTAHPLGKYFVNFVGGRARRLLDECRIPPGTVVPLIATTEVREGFDALLRTGGSTDVLAERMGRLQLELLILAVARSLQPTSGSERRALATFERCRECIDARYLEFKTVEAAAAACHVAVSHLCRLFRRFHGETPFHYLQRRQMQWAADRLHNSTQLIREVADELELDAFQFSRTFKRVHGISPSAFLSQRR